MKNRMLVVVTTIASVSVLMTDIRSAKAQGSERHYAFGEWSQSVGSEETVLGTRVLAVDYKQMLPQDNLDFGQITLWNEVTPGGLGAGTWIEAAYRATCERADGCAGNGGTSGITNRCLLGEHGFIPFRQLDGTIKMRLVWSAQTFNQITGVTPDTGKRLAFVLLATDSTATKWWGGISAEVSGTPQWLCTAQFDGVYSTGDPEMVGLKKIKAGAEITENNPLVTVPATNMIWLHKTNSVWTSNSWHVWNRGTSTQDAPPFSLFKSGKWWLCASTVQSSCGN